MQFHLFRIITVIIPQSGLLNDRFQFYFMLFHLICKIDVRQIESSVHLTEPDNDIVLNFCGSLVV